MAAVVSTIPRSGASSATETDFTTGSVGMFALQLAKMAGYKIVSTCSPRNFELVKSLGADVVIDVSAPCKRL